MGDAEMRAEAGGMEAELDWRYSFGLRRICSKGGASSSIFGVDLRAEMRAEAEEMEGEPESADNMPVLEAGDEVDVKSSLAVLSGLLRRGQRDE